MVCCNSCQTWYHCSWSFPYLPCVMNSVGIPEEEAHTTTGFICEFCSFDDSKGIRDESHPRLVNNDDEEEYILEEDESVQRK